MFLKTIFILTLSLPSLVTATPLQFSPRSLGDQEVALHGALVNNTTLVSRGLVDSKWHIPHSALRQRDMSLQKRYDCFTDNMAGLMAANALASKLETYGDTEITANPGSTYLLLSASVAGQTASLTVTATGGYASSSYAIDYYYGLMTIISTCHPGCDDQTACTVGGVNAPQGNGNIMMSLQT